MTYPRTQRTMAFRVPDRASGRMAENRNFQQRSRRQSLESGRSGGFFIPCFSILYRSVFRLRSR
jgi:hypothetical protein